MLVKKQLAQFSRFSTSALSLAPRRTRVLPSSFPIKFIPQQEAWVLERMGKFKSILQPGLALLVPVIDRIAYVQTLKEITIEIPAQSAITHDNVTLELDGVLYYRIVDPYKASYGVENAEFAVSQIAQTTMRSEIGRMTLDKCLTERGMLNAVIVEAMNAASSDWGIKCLRYEIRDIHPPENVVASMHQQVSAERKKRAEILESEGQRQASINVSEGRKQSVILESEANKQKQINSAEGEAQAIQLKATATALAITKVAKAIEEHKEYAQDAMKLSIAEKYVESFGQIAKEGNTIIVPANAADAASMVGQVLGMYKGIQGGK